MTPHDPPDRTGGSPDDAYEPADLAGGPAFGEPYAPPASFSYEGTGEPPPPTRRRRRLVLLAVFLVPVLAVAAFAAYAARASSGGPGGRPVHLVIPEGASAAQIADVLAERGVIRTPWLFRLVVRMRGVAGGLRAGKYDLRTSLSYSDAIAVLERGPAIKFTRVTVPEGKTVQEVAEIIGERTHISKAAFLRAARSGAHRPEQLPPGSTNLEGFLFPKTYNILEDATADHVVELMVRQFAREVAGLDWSRARALGISPYQAVIAASLIEREARLDRERPLVSAVIHNRLRRGMKLQIDATVQYALFLRTGRYTTRVLFRDLEIDSPYNTYRISGLPPAPIASPGIASLSAALNPARVDYLYYVLINDKGEHAFSSNERQFQKDLARARARR